MTTIPPRATIHNLLMGLTVIFTHTLDKSGRNEHKKPQTYVTLFATSNRFTHNTILYIDYICLDAYDTFYSRTGLWKWHILKFKCTVWLISLITCRWWLLLSEIPLLTFGTETYFKMFGKTANKKCVYEGIILLLTWILQ